MITLEGYSDTSTVRVDLLTSELGGVCMLLLLCFEYDLGGQPCAGRTQAGHALFYIT